jgi:hypothetical protein
MTSREVAEEAISKLNEEITDRVFLIIQGSRDLMQKYLLAVQSEGRDAVNRTIGKIVKEHYNLVNAPRRENEPASTLIQSHQIFEP